MPPSNSDSSSTETATSGYGMDGRKNGSNPFSSANFISTLNLYTMNNSTDHKTYQAIIIAELEQKSQDVERNYRAFKSEWERLNAECTELVDAGFVTSSKEIQDNHDSRHSAFAKMRELDAESTAYIITISDLKAAL